MKFLRELKGKVHLGSKVSFRVSGTGCNHSYTLTHPYKERRGGSILNRDAFRATAHYNKYLTEEERQAYRESFVKQTKYKRLRNFIQAMETRKWREKLQVQS